MSNSSRIYLDITRLLGKVRSPTPTGIDRVELEYAKYTKAVDGFFVAQMSDQLAIVPKYLAHALISYLSANWTRQANIKRGMVRLIWAWRRQNSSSRIERAVALIILKISRQASGKVSIWLHDAQFSENDWYLNVGHTGLESRELFVYLRSKTTLRNALYIHDVLPVTHPELFVEKEQHRHTERVSNVKEFGDRIFVNSKYTASHLARLTGLRAPKVLEIGTFVHEDGFQGRQDSQRKDFVSIGTIEPRKNYVWLVKQWLSFCEANQHLVCDEKLRIFGRVGWLSDHEFNSLKDIARDQKNVELITNASDAEISTRLREARAFLSASKVEGWGMPLAESLAVGTPVIASNIDAHREVTQGLAEYFDWSQPAQLQEALLDCFVPSNYERFLAKTGAFRAWNWTSHFEALSKELKSDAGGK